MAPQPCGAVTQPCQLQVVSGLQSLGLTAARHLGSPSCLAREPGRGRRRALEGTLAALLSTSVHKRTPLSGPP